MGYHGLMKKYLVHSVAMTRTDWAVDAIVAAGAFGFACLQLTFANNLLVPDEFLRRLFGVVAPPSPELALLLVALTTLPLVLRRRFPWPVLAFTLAVWVLSQPYVSTAALSLAGPLVALLTLAYERPRAEAVAGAVAVAVCVLLPFALAAVVEPPRRHGGGGPGRDQGLSAFMLVQNLAFTAAAAFAGYALHARQDYLRAAEQRAEEAERTREATAQRRVEEERLRIAREVHDITAHSLSAVSIQAAAAERLVQSDPEAAEQAIGQVRLIAKQSLGEMRAIVGVLRSGGASAGEHVPTQGTDRLADLAAYLADARVEAMVDPAAYRRDAVPAYIDVALFAMAREAATNIVRHAGASHASIVLRVAEAPDGALAAQLTVADDGRGIGDAGAFEDGHGLCGMRERAALLGGTVEVGPAESAGTAVRATIPLAGAPR